MRALTDATAGLLKPIKFMPYDRLEIGVDKDLRKFVIRVRAADSNGHRNYPSLAARNEWIARVPERKQLDGTDTWELAATDYTAEIINAVWPADQIKWSTEAKTVFDYLLATTGQQDANAERYAMFKATGEPPVHSLELHAEHPLGKYQQTAAVNGSTSEGFGYFMEQGTGKTPLIVTEVCNLGPEIRAKEGRMARILIVAPNSVRVNWQREFERFATQCGKVNVIRGGEIERISQVIETIGVDDPDCCYAVCVMSYGAMTSDCDSLCQIEWDMIALDEAHYIKWPETKRAKAAFKLRDVSARRRALTGTPVCNTPLDLYSLFEFMGDGWSGFKNWRTFKEFYGVYNQNDGEDQNGYKKLVGVQNLPFMKERLARLSFMISKKEALPELPDKTYDVLEAEMTPAQTEAYEKLANEMLYALEDQLDSSNNKSMTINNILTQLLRLAQVASGFAVWDEVLDLNTLDVLRSKAIEFFTPNPKLEVLIECLKEKTPQQKTIVWSCFVPCIKQISERLTAEGIKHVCFYGATKEADRLEAERAFNCDPDCRVFVGNPAAGGTGLNLLGYPPHHGELADTDCDHHIYFACDWSYVKRAQSEDRSHRRGTRKHVRITDLVVPETIDEEIRIRVLSKKKTALEIADIREILENCLKGLRHA